MDTADFLLFTTSNPKGPRMAELLRLFKSIDDAVATEGVRVKHYVLLQEAVALPDELADWQSQHRIFLLAPTRLSLSRARNLMIHRARADKAFASTRITAFPDDDAWYPPGLLRMLSGYLGIATVPEIFTCRYASNPVHIHPACPNEVFAYLHVSSDREFVRYASSNTLFLSSALAETVGYFDERLGVGARINGGEDLDYALRAYCLGGTRATISTLALVGHRDWSPGVRAQYYTGSLFAIARSGLGSLPLFVQLLRKVGVGVFFTLRREMSPGQLLRSLGTGLRGTADRRVAIAQPIETP
ncbi:MAG TPA: hypothetical protein VNZ68_09980 [Rhodocyclaceae bacterium]|nr:hypothetical protein [Rhodocyclaceae bacterium]